MFKTMLLSTALGLALASFLAGAKAETCVPFEWGRVAAGDLVIERGAVIVRADIAGVGNGMALQLDTGSATTELYGEAVAAEVVAAGTQTRAISLSGWDGKAPALPIAVRPAAASIGETVGTLGTDFLRDGFVLDFERQRICQPVKLTDKGLASWQALTLVNGSPVIDASEAGAPLRLLLDSGSSGFTLLSADKLSATVRTATLIRQMRVPSFGRLLNVSERKPTLTVTVMGERLQLDTVYGLDDPDIEGMLRSAGLSGLLGLRPFSAGALAFDFPGKRIGFGSLIE